jgi:SAM-dependent methyltransferase
MMDHIQLEPPKPAGSGAQIDTACDVCGATRFRVVAEASPSRCRTALCSECGLLYAAPGLTLAEIERLYSEEFTGDAGSDQRAVDGLPAEHRIRVENKRANRWAVELVERYLPLNGQRLLELRCRSGALSEALIARGAKVVSVDPFEANLRYAVERRGLTDVIQLPITSFDRLEIPDPAPFDAVIALTEHVLGHAFSPRTFLRSVRERLVPGGYLILDEKDVLHPRKFDRGGTLDDGQLHQYHFTTQTLKNCVLDAGFEIVACEVDPKRRSLHRHIHLAARKPVTEGVPQERPWSRESGARVDAIHRRLRWLERTWSLRRANAAVKQTARRLVGRAK